MSASNDDHVRDSIQTSNPGDGLANKRPQQDLIVKSVCSVG